ncbi:Hypothetical predicted protein [Olea europaea subsp. europaea]|uniref:Uncharacterized protein n=1 Tax=Olea europaea subsp. europaea TaxID=158383 RepID=A0A8S0PBM4_OLEEU|nr:Hypothetical predicted protein [Olea europaea subsp. europaea]
MAQNHSEGVCEKIFNAISCGQKNHHVHASVSSETSPKSPVQATDNPANASFLNRPNHRMIPIEFEPSIRPSPMTPKENMQPDTKNAGKENGNKSSSEISLQDLVINEECHGPKGKIKPNAHGQVEKVASMKDKPRVSVEEKPKLKWRTSSMGKTKATKEKTIQEKGDEDKKTVLKSAKTKFSDYIDHVKKKMGTVPYVDGDGGGRTGTKKDSFNHKVSETVQI